ncbi:MAG: hypothetical protein ACP5GN_01135 [Fervidicoccaceae archaeon]
MNMYRGFGLSLLLASVIIATFSYFVIGLVALAAAFVGLSIVGASMFLTPENGETSEGERFILLSWLETVSSIMEALRIGSFNMFLEQGDSVFVIVSGKEIGDTLPNITSGGIAWVGGSPALVLKSPIRRDMLEAGNVCSSADAMLVEKYNLADRIECYELGDTVSAKIYGSLVRDPRRAFSAFGGTYGMILGSIAAFLKGKSRVEYVEEGGDYILIKVKSI